MDGGSLVIASFFHSQILLAREGLVRKQVKNAVPHVPTALWGEAILRLSDKVTAPLSGVEKLFQASLVDSTSMEFQFLPVGNGELGGNTSSSSYSYRSYSVGGNLLKHTIKGKFCL